MNNTLKFEWVELCCGIDNSERSEYAGIFLRQSDIVGFISIAPHVFNGIDFCRVEMVREAPHSKELYLVQKGVKATPPELSIYSMEILNCKSIPCACNKAYELQLPISIESYKSDRFILGKIARVDASGIALNWIAVNGETGTNTDLILYEEIDRISINGGYESFIVNALKS